VGDDASALVGAWSATRYASGGSLTEPLPGTRLTAVFGDDGTLVGSTGCNTYKTGYETDGEAITIAPAAATRKFCAEPEGVMGQEAAFHQNLAAVSRFALVDGSLELYDADGAISVALSRSG
jgi:heat shock protein HslJ